MCDSEDFTHWVPNFLKQRYGENKSRADAVWRMWALFLKEHELTAPRQITREYANTYIEWRQKPNKSKCKYKCCRNTIILEVKFIRIFLDEAVRRNYTAFNPWLKLNLHRENQKQKPELPRSAMVKILREIRREPSPIKRKFFLTSFLISRYHGCRLSETHLNPLTQVDFGGSKPVISFNAKGGRTHTVFLHPKLIRRFRHMREQGMTETYKPLKSPAKEWFNLLRRSGVKDLHPGACFHSLRVTAATTLARKGINEKRAMDYIGHASTTVHRSYVRLKADDLSICADALA